MSQVIGGGGGAPNVRGTVRAFSSHIFRNV
jgi:hypothetical protein